MSKLYLIPNTIAEQGPWTIPAYIGQSIAQVRIFFVEEPKSARRLLKQIDTAFPIQECRFFDLNEHTKPVQVQEYLKVLKEGDSGIISESGCPCMADPGADLVLLAHHNHINVIPLVGPSSIALALMASGLSGQNFAFNGYLPKDKQARAAKIKALEKRALQEGQTQIFMEAPYRNQNVFDDLLANCSGQILLCVACGITGKEEFIKTKTIQQWQKTNLSLPKQPALFIINKSL